MRARHLRRLVRTPSPTRANLDTVDLLQLNIQLSLIPSNTSHALAPAATRFISICSVRDSAWERRK